MKTIYKFENIYFCSQEMTCGKERFVVAIKLKNGTFENVLTSSIYNEAQAAFDAVRRASFWIEA